MSLADLPDESKLEQTRVCSCCRTIHGCVCNIGVQECPVHPGRLKTQDQKIAFRKDWDARVEAGNQ